MSRQLEFLANGHIVTIAYLKKKFPARSYTQTFVNIKVSLQKNGDSLYQADLDDNYILSNFSNLSLFYSYLSRNRKKDILLYNNTDQITILVEGDQLQMEREVIQLKKIHILEQQQYEALVRKQKFYSEVFKSKIIHKIEKTVKNYYQEKNQKKEQEKKEKKMKSGAFESQVSFKVQRQNDQYLLNEANPFAVFYVPSNEIEEKEFRFKVLTLKSDKLYLYAQHLEANTMQEKGTKRFIQFGKSFNSTFWIDEGHIVAIAQQEGELILKNSTSNNGKIFSEQQIIEGKDLIFKITISLKQI